MAVCSTVNHFVNHTAMRCLNLLSFCVVFLFTAFLEKLQMHIPEI